MSVVAQQIVSPWRYRSSMSVGCVRPIKLKRDKVAEAFRRACTTTGFFYITNHGLDANAFPPS